MDVEDSVDFEDSAHVADDEDSVDDEDEDGFVDENSVNLSSFALSTASIQKLQVDYSFLYPKPGKLLASIFPSLTRLSVHAAHHISSRWIVR